MSEPCVLFERVDDVARLVLNRPDAMNAMNMTLMKDLRSAAERCAAESVRAVVVTGAGKAFSAGGDLGAFGDADDPSQLLKALTVELHAAQVTLANLDAPVIAAVNGTAAGAGLSLACSCDYVVATEKAKFTMAYTGAGLVPDGGSTFFLPRLIGLRRTQELMLTNRVLTASEALDWQLINQVAAPEELDAEAMKLAGRLATGPSRAFGQVKRLLLASAGRELEAQLDLEGDSIAASAGTPDGQEGIRAFLEKRKPAFKGA